MNQTIIVKYHPATNTKPDRLSATTTSGIRRYYCRYGDRFNDIIDPEYHAAHMLSVELGWMNVMIGGKLASGDTVFVLLERDLS